MVACPQGHSNPDGTEFCTECGAKIVQPKPLPVTGTQQQGVTLSMRQLIIGAVGLLVVVGGIIGGVLAVAGSGGSTKTAATEVPTQAAVATRIVTVVVPAAVSSQTPVVAQANITASPTPSPSPSPSPIATASPTPQPTPPPSPTATTPGVLYQADWSKGLNGWQTNLGWRYLNGMLINDGTSSTEPIFKLALLSPYQPMGTDYAIELEAQVVKLPTEIGAPYGCGDFGLLARGAFEVGYQHCHDDRDIQAWDKNSHEFAKRVDYTMDKEWHTYRLELSGNTIKFSIDGSIYVNTVNNAFIEMGNVGMYCDRMQMNVRAFRIIKL